MSENSSTAVLQVTESAATMIKNLIANEPVPSCLHLCVQGGGCSGFEYVFSIIALNAFEDIEKQNILIRDENKTVLLAIEKSSVQYIKGATLEYINQLIKSHFAIIKNPNSTSGCGCGNSFSVF